MHSFFIDKSQYISQISVHPSIVPSYLRLPHRAVTPRAHGWVETRSHLWPLHRLSALNLLTLPTLTVELWFCTNRVQIIQSDLQRHNRGVAKERLFSSYYTQKWCNFLSCFRNFSYCCYSSTLRMAQEMPSNQRWPEITLKIKKNIWKSCFCFFLHDVGSASNIPSPFLVKWSLWLILFLYGILMLVGFSWPG